MLKIIIALLGLYFAAVCGVFLAIVIFVYNHKYGKRAQIKKRESDEQTRKAKRLQKEVANMLSYNGEPQEEIQID